MTPFLLPAAAPASATGAASLAPLMILVPLVSAGLLLLLGRAADSWGHWLATAA